MSENIKRNEELQVFANNLAYVLSHPEVDGHIKTAFEDVIHHALTSDALIICHPDIVRVAYPIVIKRLGVYGNGIHHSLEAMYVTVRDFLSEDSQNEQFEKTEKKMTRREFLDSFATASSFEVAEILSALSEGEILPDEVFSGLADGLRKVISERGLNLNPEEWSTEYPEDIAKIIQAERDFYDIAKAEREAKAEQVLDLSEQPENLNLFDAEILIQKYELPDEVQAVLRKCAEAKH